MNWNYKISKCFFRDYEQIVKSEYRRNYLGSNKNNASDTILV